MGTMQSERKYTYTLYNALNPKLLELQLSEEVGFLADHRSHTASCEHFEIKPSIGSRPKHFLALPRINGILGGSPLPSCRGL